MAIPVQEIPPPAASNKVVVAWKFLATVAFAALAGVGASLGWNARTKQEALWGELEGPGFGSERVLELDSSPTRRLQNRTRALQNRTRALEEENVDDAEGRVLQANRTRTRNLEGVTIEIEAPLNLALDSPCKRVFSGVPNDEVWVRRCQKYLDMPLIKKDCSASPEIVPRIYHSVSKDDQQTYHQLATSAQNPSFDRHHLSDDQAAEFILDMCGAEAHAAYQCFAPPAYRADVFRFCALYSMGGVYLDEDIFPFVPLDELYSPCSTATVGHDFPWNDNLGKQMKILAGAPGAPIFHCALERIIQNVRARAYPENELELTGPQLLHKCYAENSEDVAITYHDTRNAEWPFTGMRAGQKILAYELPMSSKHFWLEGGVDAHDYADLFRAHKVYRETCELN